MSAELNLYVDIVGGKLVQSLTSTKAANLKSFVFGDVVAAVAQPIAWAIDKLAGTNVSGCSGCARRRNNLNKKFPFKTN